MSRDRTETKDRSGDVGEEFDLDIGGRTADTESETAEAASTGGLRGRVGARATGVFSPRHFIAALLLSAGGLFAAGTFLPLPGSGLLGVFLAAFVFGLVVSERRYAEAALAGGLATAAGFFLDFAVVAFLGGFGLPLAALGGVAGAVAGAVGNYFGRDLRDGLTRDI